MDLSIIITEYRKHQDQIRKIRNEVFIAEQRVPANLEYDGQDEQAKHVLARDGDVPVGTGRILANGRVGRVAVKKEYRGMGIGALIMEKLTEIGAGMNFEQIWLNAQCDAMNFYTKLGFEKLGPIFREAGIDHIKMVKRIL